MSLQKNIAAEMLESYAAEIDSALNAIYPESAEESDRTFRTLRDAERYSLLAGGKRIRPALVMESCALFGGEKEAALPFAVAVEMIHTYSLIHDDLPCMDDDDMRRGKPTNHKVFGEAYATLAGDGLLTDAFAICAMNPHVSGDCAAAAVGILSTAAGSHGMVKGQAIDMFGEQNKLTEEELVELHLGKTGAMICASVQLGCLAAGICPNDERMTDMTEFAQRIGLVFQIVDDVLDVTSSVEELGKTIGTDAENNKTTFMSFYSPEEAMKLAVSYTESAKKIIAKYEGSERLSALADLLCFRKK